jgi:hypothetical protein
MDTAEIIKHEVERQRVAVILQLLAERICLAREPAHSHPHIEVLPFDVRCADILPVGGAFHRHLLCAKALSGAIK